METMIRGYSIQLSARFLVQDEVLKQRLDPSVLQELSRIATTKPDIWLPRRNQVRILEHIVAASPDDESIYKNLVRCGDFVAGEAISTFLKLLLRVLSPKQFVRKFPDIWSHEHKGGHVEASLQSENSMMIMIRDVADFPHIGPVTVGFVGTALRAIGLKDLKENNVTWTRDRPTADDVRIDWTWH